MWETRQIICIKKKDWHRHNDDGLFPNCVKGIKVKAGDKIHLCYVNDFIPVHEDEKYLLDMRDIIFQTEKIENNINDGEITFYTSHKPSTDIYLKLQVEI